MASTDQLTRLRTLIRALVEGREEVVVFDFDSEVRKAAPSGDLTAFLSSDVSSLPEDIQSRVLLALAYAGHPEVKPYASALLGDPDYMVVLDAAAAVVACGDLEGLKIFESMAGNPGRTQDVWETLQELVRKTSNPDATALFQRLFPDPK